MTIDDNLDGFSNKEMFEAISSGVVDYLFAHAYIDSLIEGSIVGAIKDLLTNEKYYDVEYSTFPEVKRKKISKYGRFQNRFFQAVEAGVHSATLESQTQAQKSD